MKSIARRFLDKISNRSSLADRVLKALAFGISGNAISKGIQLLCGMIVARIIGKFYYGQYSIISSTVNLFVLFAGAGVEATLVRYVSRYRDNPQIAGETITTITVCNIIVGFVIGTLMAVLASQVSIWVSNTEELTPYFQVTSVVVILTVSASAFRSVLIGYEEFKKTARIEVVASILYIFMAIVFTYFYGLMGSVCGLLLLHLFRAGFYFMVCTKTLRRKQVRLKFYFSKNIVRILKEFTVPAYLSSFFVLPVNWFLNTLITKNFGFSEMAVYSVAMQWKNMISYIPTQMNQLKPIYADLHQKKEFKKLKTLLAKTTLASVGFVLPFVAIVALFGKIILGWYGDDYIVGYWPFLIIIFTMIPYAVQMQIGSFIQAIGIMWYGLGLNAIWAVVSIAGGFIALNWGLVGFAVSYMVSYLVHCLLSWLLIKKQAKES